MLKSIGFKENPVLYSLWILSTVYLENKSALLWGILQLQGYTYKNGVFKKKKKYRKQKENTSAGIVFCQFSSLKELIKGSGKQNFNSSSRLSTT